MKYLPAILLSLFLLTITLTWDSVPGAVGYKMYCGSSSGVYAAPVEVTTGVEYDVTLPGDYYCAVTAYSTTEESGYSNELFFHIPLGAPTNLRLKTL